MRGIESQMFIDFEPPAPERAEPERARDGRREGWLSPPDAKVAKAQRLVEAQYPGPKEFFYEELDPSGKYREALVFKEQGAGMMPTVVFRVPLPDNPVNMTKVERLQLAEKEVKEL